LAHPDLIQHGVPTSSIGVNQHAVTQNSVNGFK
jgi:hypothetical protein